MPSHRKPQKPRRGPSRKTAPKKRKGAPSPRLNKKGKGKEKKEKTGAPRRRAARGSTFPALPPPPENPEARDLARTIAAQVLEKKAADVVILDVRGLTSYADYFVVASGESERQVTAMAEQVETTLKHDGRTLVGSEGQETGSWVLLDYGDVVAHLFHTETRAFYDLEGLWADAPREKVA